MMPDRHSMAKEIFERIRDEPYRVSEYLGDAAPNCVLKNNRILEQLGSLGYNVRGRISEIDWSDTPIPSEIISLYPADLETTHYFVELEDSGVWRIVDASIDKGLEKAGFKIATWEGDNSPSFKTCRLLDFEEQAQLWLRWRDLDHAREYFEKAERFLKATNQWFLKVRAA